jgi:hypothetical protein
MIAAVAPAADLRQRGMETPVHVHNGVLVKIPIWIRLPASCLPVLLMEYSEEVFDTRWVVGGSGL